MATQVQFRRGSTEQNNTFTGAEGEISVNNSTRSLRVHDGSTQGGFELAKANLSNTSNVGVLTATTFSGSGASLTSIPNSALDNSSVSYGGVQLSLGSSDSTPAFDLTDAINYPYTSLTGITTSIVGDSTPQLGGNLNINGNYISGTGGINITGVITATAFYGDGSNLTGIDATALKDSGGNVKIQANESGAVITGILTTTDDINIGGGLNVTGDLVVNGTTTTINSTTISVDDKNIELASTGSPSDASADGGGITLKGDTDHTITWDNTNDSWDFSEHVNIISGKEFKIADTSVLSATTLGSNVVNSSLTSVGTIASGTWQGTAIANAYISTINTANKVDVGSIDLDGASEMGAALVDADLFLVDDGGAGTERSMLASRIPTYVFSKVSGDITIASNGTATIAANSVSLGTDTTGNYVASITNGSYITGANGGSEGAALTIAVDATNANTASKVVARDASGNFSAGTITASLSGNATTATTASTSTNVVCTENNSTNETTYLVFVDGATGDQGAETDTALTYNPSTDTLTAGNFNSSSDINLKKDIEVIQNATEILKEINGVKFSWKENDVKSVGVIAQDVEKVLPELVQTTDKETKTVNYDGLIGVLIEAIKDQQRQIDELKGKIG
jgi:hypothetical protein